MTAPALPAAHPQPLAAAAPAGWSNSSTTTARSSGSATATCCCAATTAPARCKVLSLTLPLLLDAQPALVARRARRRRRQEDGVEPAAGRRLRTPHRLRAGSSSAAWPTTAARSFVTLGLGLHAVAARASRSTHLVFHAQATTPIQRIGRGLWLLSAQRQVLNRERLRECSAAAGKSSSTRRPTGARSTSACSAWASGATTRCIDTLIQLRQPQLSKQADERALSAALTESLPPLAARAAGRRRRRAGAARRTAPRARTPATTAQGGAGLRRPLSSYAGIARRARQARGLRQAQTEFDNASRARIEAAGCEHPRAQARRSDDDRSVERRSSVMLAARACGSRRCWPTRSTPTRIG